MMNVACRLGIGSLGLSHDEDFTMIYNDSDRHQAASAALSFITTPDQIGSRINALLVLNAQGFRATQGLK